MENATGISAVEWIGIGFGGSVGNGDAILLEGTGKAFAYETGSLASMGYAPNTGAPRGIFSITLTTGANLSASTVEYNRNGTVFGASNATGASLFSRVFIQ
jgi:hypothetical protein